MKKYALTDWRFRSWRKWHQFQYKRYSCEYRIGHGLGPLIMTHNLWVIRFQVQTRDRLFLPFWWENVLNFRSWRICDFFNVNFECFLRLFDHLWNMSQPLDYSNSIKFIWIDCRAACVVACMISISSWLLVNRRVHSKLRIDNDYWSAWHLNN